MIKIKPGVSIKGLKPEILLGVMILEPIFAKYGSSLTITAGVDGKHMTGSLHYRGLAVDIRSREVSFKDVEKVLKEGKEALGTEFDFIAESTHFHCEHDPKYKEPIL